MSQQPREKFTATATPEKLRPQSPFVQVEGELTEAQLETIAGGQTWGHARGHANHNEIVVRTQEVVMSKQQRDGSRLPQCQKKLRQHKPFVQVEGELTKGQLEAIAGGGIETSL